MKTPVLALAALSLASIGAAQVTSSGGGYDIKVKYAPGKTYNYNLATAIKMSGGPQGTPPGQTINISLKQRVLSVKNGIATLQVTTTGAPGGSPAPQTVQVNNRGKIVGGKSANNGFNFLSGFPARPLKVGERWTATTPFPMGPMGNGNANVTYVFRGMKNVGGKQAAQIDFSIVMAGRTSMKGSGTAYLGAADGQLVNSTMKGNLTLSPAAMSGQAPRPGAKPMTIGLNVNMKRVG